MSTLLFVRHAQASLFDADYDQLSERGRKQAKLLGQYFARQGIEFDQSYTGPRNRHKQTAQFVAEAGGSSAEPNEIPDLDEHQVDRLVMQYGGELAERFPHLRELEVAFRASESLTDRHQSFARLFEAVADLWVSSSCPLFDVESWPEFRQRVNQGIDEIICQGGRGKKILVFTSAGTIAATLHRALRGPDETSLGLGWRLWNCSLTGFVFSGDRFSLDYFNAMPHLSQRDDWTYR